MVGWRPNLGSTSTSLPAVSEVLEEQQNHTCAEALAQQLDIEVNDKIDQMRKLAQILTLRIEDNFKNEMRKFPAGVRQLSLREFVTQYGGDVDEAQKQLTKRRPGVQPPTPRGDKARNGAAPAAGPRQSSSDEASSSRRRLETPKATPGGRSSTRSRTKPGSATPGVGSTPAPAATPGAMTPRLHETPRNARSGEVALSVNGSPIDLLNTVKASVGAKRNRPPEVLVTLDNGRELDLSEDAACRALAHDEDARDQAHAHLLTLQAQVDRALKQIGEIREHGFAKM